MPELINPPVMLAPGQGGGVADQSGQIRDIMASILAGMQAGPGIQFGPSGGRQKPTLYEGLGSFGESMSRIGRSIEEDRRYKEQADLLRKQTEAQIEASKRRSAVDEGHLELDRQRFAGEQEEARRRWRLDKQAARLNKAKVKWQTRHERITGFIDRVSEELANARVMFARTVEDFVSASSQLPPDVDLTHTPMYEAVKVAAARVERLEGIHAESLSRLWGLPSPVEGKKRLSGRGVVSESIPLKPVAGTDHSAVSSDTSTDVSRRNAAYMLASAVSGFGTLGVLEQFFQAVLKADRIDRKRMVLEGGTGAPGADAVGSRFGDLVTSSGIMADTARRRAEDMRNYQWAKTQVAKEALDRLKVLQNTADVITGGFESLAPAVKSSVDTLMSGVIADHIRNEALAVRNNRVKSGGLYRDDMERLGSVLRELPGFREMVDRAMREPEKIGPHEMGQVALIAMTLDHMAEMVRNWSPVSRVSASKEESYDPRSLGALLSSSWKREGFGEMPLKMKVALSRGNADEILALTDPGDLLARQEKLSLVLKTAATRLWNTTAGRSWFSVARMTGYDQPKMIRQTKEDGTVVEERNPKYGQSPLQPVIEAAVEAKPGQSTAAVLESIRNQLAESGGTDGGDSGRDSLWYDVRTSLKVINDLLKKEDVLSEVVRQESENPVLPIGSKLWKKPIPVSGTGISDEDMLKKEREAESLLKIP